LPCEDGVQRVRFSDAAPDESSLAATLAAGPAGLIAAAALVLAIDIASPSESLLLARWTPAKRRGFDFGVRYAAALAAAPVGLWLAAAFYDSSWGHHGLLIALAALAVVSALAAAFIPGDMAIRPRLPAGIDGLPPIVDR
jgi:hypothetical protein